MSGILAVWGAQRVNWARRGMWRSARQPPDGKQALLHRLDGGRQAHHARCLRPHRAGVARTWRQESLDRLPRRKRGLGRRWNYCGDALRMANESHYGLAAYVWSHDIGRALRAAHAIEAGWVQVNQGLGQSPGHSYGGYKESGIGREFSLEGMLESYTQRKNVTINLTH